jgi:hypothetical protein
MREMRAGARVAVVGRYVFFSTFLDCTNHFYSVILTTVMTTYTGIRETSAGARVADASRAPGK